MTIDAPALSEATRVASESDAVVRLDLFADVGLELTSALYDVRPKGYGWSGQGFGPDGADVVAVLSVSDNGSPGDSSALLLGDVWWGSRLFEIRPLAGLVHTVSELRTRPGRGAEVKRPPSGPGDDTSGTTGISPLGSKVEIDSAPPPGTNGTFVDILVVSTAKARQEQPNFDSWFLHEVDIANNAKTVMAAAVIEALFWGSGARRGPFVA